MRVDYRLKRDIFLIFFNMKVSCVFSLESPHQGDSNDYTQCTIFNMNKKNTLIFPNLQSWNLFNGTQERVQNRQGKKAIRVRAIEVLLLLDPMEAKNV